MRVQIQFVLVQIDSVANILGLHRCRLNLHRAYRTCISADTICANANCICI